MFSIRIREATQNDISKMAKVRVEPWKVAYLGILPDDFLENLSYQNLAQRWKKAFWGKTAAWRCSFCGENEQQGIVGIAICRTELSQAAVYQGEIYVLYVLSQSQNQGIGRKLVTACVQQLVGELQIKTLLICVIAENPYRKFYESVGGKAVRGKTEEIEGRIIREIGYGWNKTDLPLPGIQRR